MTIRDSILRDMKPTHALVSDLEGTLSKGRWAQSYGYSMLASTFKRGELVKSAGLVLDVMRIKGILRRKGHRDSIESDGLKLFYDVVIKHNEGARSEMQAAALKHFKDNPIPIVMGLAKSYLSGPKIIATQGGSTGAEVAAKHFGFDDFVSNIDLFDFTKKDPKLTGINLDLYHGEDKARAVSETLFNYGIRLKDCAVMGDSAADIPMLTQARVKIASPYAKPEVLAIPGIIPLSELLRGQ